MFSIDEKYHLKRLRDRIESPNARAAFSFLFEWACVESPLFALPISRGAFSAVHLSTDPDARPYADCEFAFKGSKQFVKWYFREPAFVRLSLTHENVRRAFPQADFKINSQEVTVDLFDRAGSTAITSLVESILPPLA
jgi:hypothetical protein